MARLGIRDPRFSRVFGLHCFSTVAIWPTGTRQIDPTRVESVKFTFVVLSHQQTNTPEYQIASISSQAMIAK
jgi:hypothetical protein